MSEQVLAENLQKGGMVFYPREYHVVESIDDSYALGVNEKGESCIVFIRPTEAARESARDSSTAQTVPTFMEFSETGRRAKNPCFASEDNCQATPCGVLVIEQIEKSDELSSDPRFNGFPVYVGKWASVLRESDETPKAPVGPGYVEIGLGKVTAEVNELMMQFNDVNAELNAGAISAIDAEQQKSNLSNQIMALRKKWYVTVMLRHKEMFQISELSEQNLRGCLEPILNKYTMKGLYGGAIVRVRNNGVVISSLSASCNMSFDYQKGVPKGFSEIFGDFMQYHGKRILRESISNGYQIDIIPTIRINCGPRGMDKFNKDFAAGTSSKVLKTYVEQEYHSDPSANYVRSNAFLFANLGVRLYEIGSKKKDAGNLLVSSVHAFSSPKGNVLSIGPDGENSFYIDVNLERRNQNKQQAA